MRIVILGSTNSRNSAGVFEVARNLGIGLSRHPDVDVRFLMFNDEFTQEDKKYYAGLPLHSYTKIGPVAFGFSTDLALKLRQLKPDLVHTQTIWMYKSIVGRMYCTEYSTPYVVSPHGMLDSWQLKQSVWKKKAAMALYEKKHLERAAAISALCSQEYGSIRDLGIKTPVALIPNGVTLRQPLEDDDPLFPTRPWKQTGRSRTLLFLSRLHPKKGLEHLLEGWASTKPSGHSWQLVIAGDSQQPAYLKSLIEMMTKLKLNDSVQFIGGQYGINKEACFSFADAYILSSFSEGLPMSVLEAWSYKLPVIMTAECNLTEGFERKAAIPVEPTAESVAAGIRSMIDMEESELSSIGDNGYELVKKKYSWQHVAKSTLQLYEWILGQRSKPDFVLD